MTLIIPYDTIQNIDNIFSGLYQMKKTPNISKPLLGFLNDKKIVTMDELKDILKTKSRMTVFRKLSQLNYISSCSHSGKFYSLKRIARFNKYGLWAYKSVLFSKYRTLKKTLEFLIEDSSNGYTSGELNSILKVKVEDALLELVKSNILNRSKISSVYVYFSKAPKLNNKQELTRRDRIQYSDVEMKPEIFLNELKAALILFFSTLDEKQRRLYAGYESLKIGYGGDKRIAQLLDIDTKTVGRGRQELLGRKVNIDIIREKGGGRKHIKKKFQL